MVAVLLRRDWSFFGVLTGALAVLGLALAGGVGSPGSTVQLWMQVVLAVPLLGGLAVCAARLRQGRWWLVPLVAFALAVPTLAQAWQDPPGPSQPGDEHCSARGFVPHSWSDAIEPYTWYVMPWLALACLVAAAVALVRRHWAEGGWGVLGAGVVLLAMIAAATCAGT